MRLILLTAATFLFASSAQAQMTGALCSSVKSFFTSPPSQFIADRGYQMDDDGWASKTSKNCSVLYMKDPYDLKDGFGHPHRITCSLTEEKSEAALMRAYTDAVAELRKCIPGIHARLKFAERVIDSGQSRTTVWEAKEGKDGYRVVAQVYTKPPHDAALFSIVFQPGK